MEEMPYVFICHRSDAKLFTIKLSKDLRSYGVDPWLPSERIKPGDNLASALDLGLESAAVVLIVLSRAVIDSPDWLRREYEVAEGIQKKIIPIVIHENLKLPLFMSTKFWIDFNHDGYEKGLRRLLDGLGDLVKADQPVEDPGLAARGYVFLSYSEKNQDFVVKLKGFLAELGYAFWDYAESDRDYHSQLYQELEGVIRDAAATVCILSPSWRQSKWTVKEYLYSEDVGTPVLLIRAEQMEPTLITAGIPYIDMVANETEGFEKLARELRRKRL